MDVVVTCEHACNDVPVRYAKVFQDAGEALAGHLGWDPGAREMASHLARGVGAPLFLGRVSRLLVELNRSEGHRDLFSRWARRLLPQERESILETYYRPFRRAVETTVQEGIDRGRHVLHLGVHTFTPVWKGRARTTDLGLLFDPRRSRERDVARFLKVRLVRALPGLSVHLNRPYRGWTDGHTTCLRNRLPEPGFVAMAPGGPPCGSYAGVELEVSQRFALGPATRWTDMLDGILEAVAGVVLDGEGSHGSIAPHLLPEEIATVPRIPR